MTPLRDAIIAEALSWVGTPYHHAGKVKGPDGVVDCGMLLVAVYQAVGLCPADFDPRPYTPDWYLHRSEEIYLNLVSQYSNRTEEPQPGDVVLFQLGRCVGHGGIVLEGDRMVHAFRPVGAVVVSEIDTMRAHLHSFWSVD